VLILVYFKLISRGGKNNILKNTGYSLKIEQKRIVNYNHVLNLSKPNFCVLFGPL